LKLSNAMLNEPIIVSQLVRVRMIELALNTIRRLCEIAPPSEQCSRDIVSLLEDFDSVRPLIRAIDSERLLVGEWVFNLPKSELLKQPDLLDWEDDSLAIVKIYFKPTFLADRAAYLRMMLELAQRFERPYLQEELEAVEEMVKRERHPLTRALTPAMLRVKQIHSGMLAELRIVRAGLSLLQYKQAEDAFPNTLETLQLTNVKDPFSNGSLLYRTERDGFVLYSVGPDQKDNNGSPKQDEQREDWDIVWQFPGIEM